MNNPVHISESLETILLGKVILEVLDADPGSGMEKNLVSESRIQINFDPGSRMEKIRIRDPE